MPVVRRPSTRCAGNVPAWCVLTAFGGTRLHRRFFLRRLCFFSETRSSPARRSPFSQSFYWEFQPIGSGKFVRAREIDKGGMGQVYRSGKRFRGWIDCEPTEEQISDTYTSPYRRVGRACTIP